MRKPDESPSPRLKPRLGHLSRGAAGGVASLWLLVAAAPLSAQTTATPLPGGDVFPALLADPKEPEAIAGVARLRSSIRNTMVGAAAFGVNIGLVRWTTPRRDSLQVGLSGGVFAQFDLEKNSIDLLNADYLIGLPLTYHRGAWALRARLYHQSSHLGDEFLLEAQPARINLSFESAELIVSRVSGPVRLYGGGEYLVRHEPRDLSAGALRGGIEFRPAGGLFSLGQLGRARFVAGLDVKRWEHDHRSYAWSVRTGLEFSSALRRRWSVLFAAYDGPAPYGQFYTESVSYLGVGLHFPL